MARGGFLIANQFRDYPFITRLTPLPEAFRSDTPDLPQAIIVDFNALVEVQVPWDETQGNMIYLHALSRAGSTFTFDFRISAPDAHNYHVVFTRHLTDPEFTITWATAELIEASSISASIELCTPAPPWSAVLSTGSLAALDQYIADGHTYTFELGLWQIEPSRIQSLWNTYVRTLNLANYPRTYATVPEGCPQNSLSADPIINATCLVGTREFREGYNCIIRQEDQKNTIIIGAAVGGGAGRPCGEVPLYTGEPSADDGRLLSGGPTCNELITTINGVGSRNFTIRSGPGFRVYADPDNPHTLIVDRALADFSTCPPNAE